MKHYNGLVDLHHQWIHNYCISANKDAYIGPLFPAATTTKIPDALKASTASRIASKSGHLCLAHPYECPVACGLKSGFGLLPPKSVGAKTSYV
jgi:hypothetical protein